MQLLLPAGLFLALLTAPAAFAQSSFGNPTVYGSGGASPVGVAAGDVNGDGRPDIVVANQDGNSLGLLLGQASPVGTFAPALLLQTGGSDPTGVTLGDVNGDGRLDIVVANQASGTLGVLLNNPAIINGFATAVTYSSGGNSPNIVALGDVNGDGRVDAVTANTDSNTVAVLLGQATGPTFGLAAVYGSGGSLPIGVALGDVNGDGRLDIATACLTANQVAVLLNVAAAPGTFGAATTYASGGNQPLGVALVDVNADSRPDVVVSNSGSSTVGALLNQATTPGTFGPAATYSCGGSSPNLLAVADINGDNRPDVITGNASTGTVGVLTGYANGVFTVASYGSGSVIGTNKGPVGVAVGDVDGDGRRDLIATNYSNQSVGVLLNTYRFLASTPAAGQAQLNLYPNPAHDAFAVELPAGMAGPVQTELLNTLGQVVHRQQAILAAGSPPLRVETAGLPAGAYTLRLQAGAQVLARRVLLR